MSLVKIDGGFTLRIPEELGVEAINRAWSTEVEPDQLLVELLTEHLQDQSAVDLLAARHKRIRLELEEEQSQKRAAHLRAFRTTFFGGASFFSFAMLLAWLDVGVPHGRVLESFAVVITMAACTTGLVGDGDSGFQLYLGLVEGGFTKPLAILLWLLVAGACVVTVGPLFALAVSGK